MSLRQVAQELAQDQRGAFLDILELDPKNAQAVWLYDLLEVKLHPFLRIYLHSNIGIHL